MAGPRAVLEPFGERIFADETLERNMTATNGRNAVLTNSRSGISPLALIPVTRATEFTERRVESREKATIDVAGCSECFFPVGSLGY